MLETVHTVTKEESDGSRFINFFSLNEKVFSQRQIEQRGSLIFMRAKRRVF